MLILFVISRKLCVLLWNIVAVSNRDTEGDVFVIVILRSRCQSVCLFVSGIIYNFVCIRTCMNFWECPHSLSNRLYTAFTSARISASRSDEVISRLMSSKCLPCLSQWTECSEQNSGNITVNLELYSVGRKPTILIVYNSCVWWRRKVLNI